MSRRKKAYAPVKAVGLFLLAAFIASAPGRAAELQHRHAGKVTQLTALQKVQIAETLDLAALDPPTAEDLAETADIRFSALLALWAEAIGPDPVALYNFVHDNVEFDIYFGSLKGSEGCLAEAQGNDFDQASLLMAFLRYHGIPCRYQFGTLRLTVEQAQGLALTNVDLETAGYQETNIINQSLSSLGIPAELVLDIDENALWVVADLCWVRAYVPSSNYRGRPGDESASDWLYLFPAFKRHEYLEPEVNLIGQVGFDPDDYFANATLDVPPGIYYQQKLLEFVDTHGLACPTLENAMVQRRIVADRLEVLPGALPAHILVGGQYQEPVTWSQLPDSFRHKLGLEASWVDPEGFTNADFRTELSIPETYGYKIGIEWNGASKPDQDAIDAAGGIANLPQGVMANVRALVTRDDIPVATGGSLVVGTAMKVDAFQEFPNYPIHGAPTVGLRTAITDVGVENEYDMSAGGAAALALAPQRVPESVFGYHVEKVEQLRSGGASASRLRTQELQIIGLDLLRQNDAGNDLIAGVYRYNFNRVWHVIEVADLLLPPDGGGGDAGTHVSFQSVISPHPINGDTSFEFDVTELAGYQGSGLEFTVLRQHLNETCVSMANLMQRTVQEQDGYVLVDGSNVGTFHTQLVDIPQKVIDKVRSFVNSDPVERMARVPKRRIRVNQWLGVGYFIGNSVDGTGLYLIDGGYQ